VPDKTLRVSGKNPSESEQVRLAREQLAIAKQMLETSRKQKKAAASLPEREAVDCFLALADERQQQMERFDQIQKVRNRNSSPPTTSQESHVLRELGAAARALFQETARTDAATLELLENSRNSSREKLEKIRRGREALRTYTPQNPTTSTGGAFIDRSR
jgi:hypothetical protein